jgi:hypothetical protein
MFCKTWSEKNVTVVTRAENGDVPQKRVHERMPAWLCFPRDPPAPKQGGPEAVSWATTRTMPCQATDSFALNNGKAGSKIMVKQI